MAWHQEKGKTIGESLSLSLSQCGCEWFFVQQLPTLQLHCWSHLHPTDTTYPGFAADWLKHSRRFPKLTQQSLFIRGCKAGPSLAVALVVALASTAVLSHVAFVAGVPCKCKMNRLRYSPSAGGD